MTASRPDHPTFGDPVACLRSAVALQDAGDTLAAQAALRRAARAAPGWAEPHLRLALSLRAAGETAAAEASYETALALDPGRAETLLGLAVLLLARGAAARAVALLARCCAVDPGRAEAWHALGLACLRSGDPSGALAALAEAQRLHPTAIEPALHRAEAALLAGSAEAELARLQAACAADPLDVPALATQGFLLDRLGRREAAADLLEAAAALAPAAVAPARLLGRVLATSNQPARAEAALARAIALDPRDPAARNDRAAMLMRLQRHAEARDVLLDLVESDGRQPIVLCNLANATTALGDQEEAVRLAREAVARAPDQVLPWRTLCNALPYAEGTTGAALLAALRECSDRLPRGPEPRWDGRRDPDRRLRIGLLSGSLRTHPVGWLALAGLEALDPAGFEIVCLSQHSTGDALAQRFHALASAWHEVDALDDDALAALARELEIDLLIDLGGYGESGRMAACARRLAPVQIKWVGMQNHSTGLPEMDWFITDRWETPPALEPLYSERLLRLPDGYVCYSPPAHAPEVGPLPARSNGFVTFGCLNNLAKLTPGLIAAWARILRALPTARLLLKTHQLGDPATAARLHARFAALGVAAERIELQGASPHRAFLDVYNRVDLVLDPFPYSGGLTTCEALWMGAPVLTLPGETFASRHSLSHLGNVGLHDWVAADVDDYVATALRKAGDLDELEALRAGLRERLRTSPLCDAARFGRNLGKALRTVWRDWCAAGEARPLSPLSAKP